MGADRAKAEQLARELVHHLPGWELRLLPTPEEGEHNGDWADLVRPDGATIRVSVGGWRLEGRVVFRGMSPRYADGTAHYSGKSERTSITCDATRAPSAIAKDLLRRFLPAYLDSWETQRAYVEEHDRNGREAQSVASRLASAIGARVGENKVRRGDGVCIWNEPSSVRRLRVQPAYRGTMHEREVSVSFEVSDLDPETAAVVLQTIREAEERATADVKARVGEAREEENLIEQEHTRAQRPMRLPSRA